MRRLASKPLQRSVAFVTFTAEEAGLLGSRAFLGGQLPTEVKIGFMLNLDMIGRNSHAPLMIYGDGFADGLTELVLHHAQEASVPVTLGGREVVRNSDHDSFFRRGVPVLSFFSGVHGDYHTPADHADKVDYDRLAGIVRLAEALVRDLADRAVLPVRSD